MTNIPGVGGFVMPSYDPLTPYRWRIARIYKLLLVYKERVVRCEPVMYEGEHVLGMYDIEITQDNDPRMDCNKGGTISTTTFRLSPISPDRWNHHSR